MDRMNHPTEAVEAVTQAPEKIWAEDRSTFGRIVAFGTQTVRTPIEYTRADLCTPAPDVVELVEALREASKRLSWFGDKVGCEIARAVVAKYKQEPK